MARVQIGVMALRKPNGEFLPSTPIYEDIPDTQIKPSKLTATEERQCDELTKMLVKKFKQYKDGIKK
ncbi:hypothetical protein SDC9_137681 [bioreactor metagenome]|uniref:Uncharacterized protein n=1 Tax=bioreactor metagenome TaxID=1076179 RepID=A0A645DM87_9ZZZZ